MRITRKEQKYGSFFMHFLIERYHRLYRKVLSFLEKGTIVLAEKYYRFWQKVLSFYSKSTIVLLKKYYRFW
ncbi:hypothetical protein HMPREF9140_00739 [Prevotella micans F0438]|uniref:Uncharacterized protein n=1 Tax=Prevotella micans F0438 TaxID=883158 RepID=H1Q1F1_9BACT|nr:hypothetical protein HMPREF9140_00739 [Prevotella micans F0438]